jgi:hypothetical protein
LERPSLKRAVLGYRRQEVDALLSARQADAESRDGELRARDGRIAGLEQQVEELEAVAERLSERVVARERELGETRRELDVERLRREEGLHAVEALSMQIEELRSQARGQATRIRLRALQDAAELSSRLRELVGSSGEAGQRALDALEAAVRRVAGGEEERELPTEPDAKSGGGADPAAGANGESRGLYAGRVHLDVGPLGDFSQLIRIEDAARAIEAASSIAVMRFSGGRATLAMELDEPVELLRELEERSDIELVLRRAGEGELVLDVGPEASAA